MRSVSYEETVPAGKVVVGGILAGIILCLGLAITFVVQGLPAPMLILLALVVFLSLLLWNFRAIHLTVDGEAFAADFGVFNRTHIPLGEITSCRPTRATFGRYMGIGVRAGTDGTWAYTTWFGPAVEVRAAGRRPFVVSTKNPAAVCDAIEQARSGRG
ncbi:MAG TPA: hypothetical protein VHS06_01860 [Chloroflexota bacterium]|nr:hypothetical protein [Chloroflexota bacterium]